MSAGWSTSRASRAICSTIAAEPVEVELAVLVPGDEFAVELHVASERLRELRQQLGHVPAASAAGAGATVCADEAAKPVQLRLEAPPSLPAGIEPERASIGSGTAAPHARLAGQPISVSQAAAGGHGSPMRI
jgi:hypothetical protein